MDRILRKGIAFDPVQLKEFDSLIKNKGYRNRSEAIRDLIRGFLIDEHMSDPEKFMIGTLTFVYDHHKNEVQHNLTEAQHNSPHMIISSLHVHIDPHNCLEILILRGKVKNIQSLSDSIIATKGVKHGKLVLTNV